MDKSSFFVFGKKIDKNFVVDKKKLSGTCF